MEANEKKRILMMVELPEGRKHDFMECNGCDYGCMFCRGGLSACRVCDGFEGSLPLDCPGKRMTTREADAVYAGDLDYAFDVWWVWRDGKWVKRNA